MTPTATERTHAPAALVAFRVLFGALILVAAIRFVAMGWVDALYVQPQLHFRYFGFGWVPIPPREGIFALYGVMGLAGLGVSLGAWYRLSALALFASFTWLELLDVTTYLNHYYFISLLSLLLVFLPLGRVGSVDARLRPALRLRRLPRWVTLLLRVQVGCVYAFAGLAKLDADWLLAAQPLATWLPARAELPLLGPLLALPLTAYVMSWAGAAFDLLAVPGLLWRRTRAVTYLAVVGFHLVTGWLFPIGMFPLVMIACATVFFDPRWPLRLLALLPRRAARRLWRALLPREGALPTGLPVWGRAVLGAWIAVQVLFPLRAALYPGNTRWTEEGFRFAWRVMLIEKTGLVDFQLHEPTSGRRWTVHPRGELTPLQVKVMSTQPDLILQYAHHLAARVERELGTPVEVRADAWASLNGRPSQRLIDPSVDLARVKDGLAPKAWIIPLEEVPARAALLR